MGREHHRAATLGVLANRAPELTPPFDVHACRRLVEDEEPRIGEQRHRESQPLLFAAGALGDASVGDLADACTLEHLGYRTCVRVQRRRVCDRLADGKVLEETTVLHHRGDFTTGDRVVGRAAVHADTPGVGARESQQHVDRGGLSGAVRAKEGDDLAGVDLQAEIVDGGNGTEPLRQVAKVYGEHWSRVEVASTTWPSRARSILGVRLVGKAVQPLLAGFGGCDDRMTAAARVLAGVFVRRAVATARGAALLARAQMHPSRADLHALLAFTTFGGPDGGDGGDVGAWAFGHCKARQKEGSSCNTSR